MPTRRHLAAGGLASAVLLLAVGAGCGTLPGAQGSTHESPAPARSQASGSSSSSSPSTTPASPAVKLSTNVDDGADGQRLEQGAPRDVLGELLDGNARLHLTDGGLGQHEFVERDRALLAQSELRL